MEEKDCHDIETTLAVVETKLELILESQKTCEVHNQKIIEDIEKRVISLEKSRQWLVGAFAAVSFMLGVLAFLVSTWLPKSFESSSVQHIPQEVIDGS